VRNSEPTVNILHTLSIFWHPFLPKECRTFNSIFVPFPHFEIYHFIRASSRKMIVGWEMKVTVD
jgi:hypothetical protein